MSGNLVAIPTRIDVGEDWLVEYWAGKFGVSPACVVHAVSVVGQESRKVGKHLKSGHRIAIRDECGVDRLVARITLERSGFGLSVPYHPSQSGWLAKAKVQYDKQQYFSPCREMDNYTVDTPVKLSMHMDGFVQFSRGGGKPIISGYNPVLGEIKGIGLRAPDDIDVVTGPLCGVVAHGLEDFTPITTKPAECFVPDDLWHHPRFSTPDDKGYNLEFFMLPRAELRGAFFRNGHRILIRELPFKSQLDFRFELRVIELPNMPFFLGLVVSRVRTCMGKLPSGYTMVGPGVASPDGEFWNITAFYPRPDFVDDLETKPLDYEPDPPTGDAPPQQSHPADSEGVT